MSECPCCHTRSGLVLGGNGTTYLALEIDCGRAGEITFIICLLQGRRGPWAHHWEIASPHPFHCRVVGGGGEEAGLVEEDDLPRICEGEEFSRDVVGSVVTACGLDKNHSTISTVSEYRDAFF